MATAARAPGYDDLCRAREDGNRYELIDGELLVIAGPSPRHQWTSSRLFVAFDRAIVEPGLGFVFTAPLDVHLGGQQYAQPDLLVVLTERASIIGPTLIDGAPDLVVEISSTSSRAIDRTRKLALYARPGVREYWLVDLGGRAVTVHALPTGEGYARVEQRAEAEARSTILPGLVVQVATLFSGLPPLG
ncbi:MAG: Uma2 family endonuclease [Chloroflexota bacterium]|nr:Uma2 family endonuclease [Chloroflexota bacterium]